MYLVIHLSGDGAFANTSSPLVNGDALTNASSRPGDAFHNLMLLYINFFFENLVDNCAIHSVSL